MRRIAAGLVCALAMALAFACAESTSDDGTGTGTGTGMTPNVCGDDVCAPSEIGFCAADCGTGSSGSNGTNGVCGNGTCEMAGENVDSCPADCGTGSGSGSLDCMDFVTAAACVLCVLDPTTCMPPISVEACQACAAMGSNFR